MTRCPACAAEVPAQARFCMACGAAVPAGAVPATAGAAGPASPALDSSAAITRFGTPSGWRSASTSSDSGRFVAGHVLAGRYRVTGLLGRGGMGEVYRADDLRLGMPVALKLLPEGLLADAARLARFHNEVRLARQVTHANVCRIHDIAEAEGHLFLTMEYVDGEDLASLLRRIGRLPSDKGVEVARQICAGLAAAHDQGVLHRDLKPANIMVDGRGRARITDFGLAEAEGAVAPDDRRAGTPLYMAPEQLEGREVTSRSDIFALGLVLYEIFTGRPAFPADSEEEWRRARRESTPATPRSVQPGLDPSIERVILRCLDRDPRQRPGSALSVSAALPGGDPLAAALAAGETPSPAMVAAAGAEGALAPWLAWTLLLISLGLMAMTVFTSSHRSLVNVAGLDFPPAVLEQKARDALTALGHDAPVADEASGFDELDPLLDWIEKNDASAERWTRLATGRPPGMAFWYRRSPRLMVSRITIAIVKYDEPPAIEPGMARVVLDPKGRLLRFQSVPYEMRPVRSAHAPFDWSRAFALADLDPSRFEPAEPEIVPPVYCDEPAAWKGTLAQRPDLTVRVEACALEGRPVHFSIQGPWDHPVGPPGPVEPVTLVHAVSPEVPLGEQVRVGLLIAALIGALFLARRNVALGRGDRRGAFAIALYIVVMHVVVWALWASHVPVLFEEWNIFTRDTGWTLFNAAAIWLFYLALEPYVRRLWPETIISWSRVMAGRFRDPRVGRDLLIGLALGMLAATGDCFDFWIASWMGQPPLRPEWAESGNLMPVFAASNVLDAHVHAIIGGFQILSLMLILKILLRRVSLAGAVLAVLLSLQFGLGSPDIQLVRQVMTLVLVSLFTVAMLRFGLLTAIGTIFVTNAFGGNALTPHLGSWFSGPTWMLLISMTAILIAAFHTSLGGRPALRLMEE